MEIAANGGYIAPSGRRVVLPPARTVRDAAQWVRIGPPCPDNPPAFATEIRVLESDSFLAAKALLDRGLRPCVLNMANRRTPGGGVLDGSGAQEENLFRRSNLFQSLYPFDAWHAARFKLEPRPEQYPMDRDAGGAFTPVATVFRGPEDEGYPLLEEPYGVSVVSVAALNRPATDPRTGDLTPGMAAATLDRMRTLFRLALANGNDSLVLGAWGCGAFRNPPAHMARLFRQTIESTEFANRFAVIVFAILEDHNSRRPGNPEGNLAPFARAFGNEMRYAGY